MFSTSVTEKISTVSRIQTLINRLETVTWDYVRVNFPAVYSQIGDAAKWPEAIELIYIQKQELKSYSLTWLKSNFWFGEPFENLRHIIQLYLLKSELQKNLDDFKQSISEELENNLSPNYERVKSALIKLKHQLYEVIEVLKWKTTNDIFTYYDVLQEQINAGNISVYNGNDSDDESPRSISISPKYKTYSYTFKTNDKHKVFKQNGLLEHADQYGYSRLGESIKVNILTNCDILVESLLEDLDNYAAEIVHHYKIVHAKRQQREQELLAEARQQSLEAAAIITEKDKAIQLYQSKLAFFERKCNEAHNAESARVSALKEQDAAVMAAAPTLRSNQRIIMK